MAKTFHFRSWMIGQIRRCTRRYPPYYIVRNNAKEEYTIPSKQGKPMRRVRFLCAKCGKYFNNKDTVVDHIDPVIDPKVGFPVLPNGEDDWNTYLNRLFCPIENLQVLCKEDHDIKSGKETKVRTKTRRNNKKNVDKQS